MIGNGPTQFIPDEGEGDNPNGYYALGLGILAPVADAPLTVPPQNAALPTAGDGTSGGTLSGDDALSNLQANSIETPEMSPEVSRAQREQDMVSTVATLKEIMESDDYLPNSLSSVNLPSYKLKLFMTPQREVVKKAGVNSIPKLYEAIDSLPQAVIAESGVTAGFNISSLKMTEMVSHGFQNRNTGLTTMTMVINEPNGSGLIEAIAKSSRKLGISNYQQHYFYLETTFTGYDDTGAILTNPLADAGLPNGGRWIHQIKIVNIEVAMNELGATYTLKCQPSALDAFDDKMVGTVPDNMTVSGGNIGEFLTNFGTALTKAYDKRYLGELFRFKFVAKPLDTPEQCLDPNLFRMQQSEQDSISTTEMNISASGNGVTVHIPRGTRVSDVIDFVWTSCEDTQKLMLDTKAPDQLQDEDGMWNGKPYRRSIVPRIEPDVSVFGYDPIMNCYMQEITYSVYSFSTMAVNLSPKQAQYAADVNKNVGGLIAKQLKDKGYLQKRYDYRYTGTNTEVLNFDLDFNFSFAAALPRLAGWRADLASSRDGEKRLPANGQRDGTEPTELSASGGAGGAAQTPTGNPPENAKPDPSAPDMSENAMADNGAKMTESQAVLDALYEERRLEVEGANNPARLREIDENIAKANNFREALRADMEAQRRTYNRWLEEDAQRVISSVDTFFSEDEILVEETAAYRIRYRQSNDEGAALASGVGTMGHWHRGESLTGALLNQLYEPMVNALVKIDLDIRGDPYWLGPSNLERRALNLDAVKPAEYYQGHLLPNFQEGDNTFALSLRFPATTSYDGDLIFRPDDVFNGLYRCNRVEHTFEGGQFTQKLSAMKLELAQLPARTEDGQNLIIEQIRQ